MDKETAKMFNETVIGTFAEARNLVKNTALLPAALRFIKYQREAVQIREKWMKEGLHVPPVIILSVTKRCNLRCAGCYHHAQNRQRQDITTEQMKKLFDEAQTLGVSVIPIAGGEPLTRKDIIPALMDYPKILFPVFTNGLLIDEATAKTLRKHRNIVPIISIEGYREETDMRRGVGVYDEIMKRFKLLDKEGIFFGASITVTSGNLDTVTSDEYVETLCENGVQTIIYVEYVPFEHGSDGLVLSKEQRLRLMQRTEELRKKHYALFINFPGDEDKLGGCLAAGRGFLHISQDGGVEPCPASPFSDSNIGEMSLKEALRSQLLAKIRETPHSLGDSVSGCALFDKREWVQSLVQSPIQSTQPQHLGLDLGVIPVIQVEVPAPLDGIRVA